MKTDRTQRAWRPAGKCSSHPAHPNLAVLPYVRGRLAFAQLAHEILSRNFFDCLLVDMPAFLNNMRWLSTPLKHFPLVSSLIIRTPSRDVLLPFGPNDAACAAAFVAGNRSIRIECIDDSNLLNFPPETVLEAAIGLPDDYFAVTDESLDGYFGPAWGAFDRHWSGASRRQQASTLARAAVAASRIRRCAESCGNVLLVCEWQLWWSVRECLGAGELPEAEPPARSEQPWPAALVLEDPNAAWIQGRLDDYPSLAHEFWKVISGGQGGSFDKKAELETELNAFDSPWNLSNHGHPSLRCLETFRRYLRTRVAADGRMLPQPARHLFDSAQSCVSKEYASGLARRLLEYPAPAEDQDQPTYWLIAESGIQTGGKPFELPDDFHAANYYAPFGQSDGSETEACRTEWVWRTRPFLTRQETRDTSGAGPGYRYSVQPDYRVQQAACERLRDVVARRSALETKRSWGSLSGGIDWRSTLASRERGENAVYVRKRRRSAETGPLDETTPVVFLFAPDSVIDRSSASCIFDTNATQRKEELLGKRREPGDQPPDMVCSVFMTSSGSASLCRTRSLCRDQLTSLTLLYTRDVVGVDRYNAITKRLLPERQARLDPRHDPVFGGLPLSQLGAGWAVKHAGRCVIVVSATPWKPSPRTAELAEQRGVEILVLPAATLSEGLMRRLSHLHFTSGALSRHPRRLEIVGRFLN